VGVLLPNSPDYLTLTTALNRVAAVSVLLNAGVRGDSLTQALGAGSVTLLVTDKAHGVGDGVDVCALSVLRTDAETLSTDPPEDLAPTRIDDVAMLIFTSGTTGLPKAARITNRRMVAAALGTAAACRLGPRDTVYCALPLYHATGMLVAVGGAIAGGARLALAPKFSAATFWTDVRRVGATVVFYVGELCRYLVNAPKQPEENRHPVRLLAGNGMRADVWEQFTQRFGAVQIIEFYGSTEGNVVLANLSGEKVGCVGRPLTGTGNVALLSYDVESDVFLRDANGLYQRCDTGEEGVLVAKIHSGRNPLSRFDGYVNEDDTHAKIIRGVMAPGDSWFVTGDLMRRDEDGDYWFVDRLGDTYRWKGENVSSEQVASVLAKEPTVAMVAVYGVEIPGREGRAGTAAIQLVPGARFDGVAMGARVGEHLFAAARPRFIRIVESLEVTDSWKVRKFGLQQEGIPLEPGADPIFWYDEADREYKPLNEETYGRLTT